jgi:hypothetical protein
VTARFRWPKVLGDACVPSTRHEGRVASCRGETCVALLRWVLRLVDAVRVARFMKRCTFIVGLGVAALAVCSGDAHAIKRADMPGFCQGKVLATYAVAGSRIKMREVVKGTDGSYSVDGTVHTGRKAVERFRCEFDAKGQFSALRELPRGSRS